MPRLLCDVEKVCPNSIIHCHSVFWFHPNASCHGSCQISSTPKLANVVIMGDFNFQPACLGAGPDPSPRRREAWRLFMIRWTLSLHNPYLGDETPSSIWLPLRGREASVRTGSTRHGPHTGRAIDLVLSSSDVELVFTIHNSLHCGGAGHCQWPDCQEYAGGDHF